VKADADKMALYLIGLVTGYQALIEELDASGALKRSDVTKRILGFPDRISAGQLPSIEKLIRDLYGDDIDAAKTLRSLVEQNLKHKLN
jgi:hypothetical protein